MFIALFLSFIYSYLNIVFILLLSWQSFRNIRSSWSAECLQFIGNLLTILTFYGINENSLQDKWPPGGEKSVSNQVDENRQLHPQLRFSQ